MNRDTATHLQFSVLFNFYILLIWLLLLMRTSVYIRVLLVKRTRRRTDGKTFVNIIIRQYSSFLDISTHFVKPPSCPHLPPLLLDSPLSPTNGFVGGTFNVFSLTKIWRKMCIYLFCNFSEEFNCKGNVKSMYSDYASGIAFLIKTKSSINERVDATGTCVWSAADRLCIWCFVKNGLLRMWPTIMR